MDLKSIINYSDSSNTVSPRPTSVQEPPLHHRQNYQQSSQRLYETPSYQPHQQDARPPQPPPLQTPPSRDIRSPTTSSYQSQSPYTNTPTASFNGTQYPFPQQQQQQPGQNSTHSSQGGPTYTPQSRTTTIVAPGTQSYGQPSPSILTPTATTPGSNYGHPQFARPQSSHSHSSSTPISAQSHMQNFSRESSHAAQVQNGVQYHRHSNQSYQSQPGTPLGPPPSINRPSPTLHREGSGSYAYDYQRRQSGGSLSSQAALLSPIVDAPRPIASSPTGYSSQQHSIRYRTDEERERSLSVSPKTRLPSQARIVPSESPVDYQRSASGSVAGVKRKGIDQLLDERPATQSQQVTQYYINQMANGPMNSNLITPNFHSEEQERGVRDITSTAAQQPRDIIPPILNSSFSGNSNNPRETERYQATPNHILPSMQPLRAQAPTPLSISTHQSPVKPTSTPSSVGLPNLTFTRPVSSAPAIQSTTDVKMENSDATLEAPAVKLEAPAVKIEASAPPSTVNLPHQQNRKRTRLHEPPVYAQKANRGNPLLSNRRPPFPKMNSVKTELLENSSQGSVSRQPGKFEGTNGHQGAPNKVSLPVPQPDFGDEKPLGPWEKSITNVTPYEEVTRLIANFIFREVVTREDVGSVLGATLEIEAKLGQIIDKNTNDRLKLPVLSECVLSKGDPNLRTNFKSSMTESQHSSLNAFLNLAVRDTLPIRNPSVAAGNLPEKPRIPMSYVHTKECDSFYELSPATELSLPQSVKAVYNPRHSKAKVRLTHDQKTGNLLAKIIKIRLADMDVYSPHTAFDWRVSINLEMEWKGNMKDLNPVQDGPLSRQKSADRNKDRMTYKHLAYQIDLTQVTPTEAIGHIEKEHELEVEVSFDEVCKQGSLARNNQPNQYEELIRVFIDNVRLLARQCPL